MGSTQRYPGLEQLICAALADPDLAAHLIADPKTALDQPIPDVQLSPAEHDLAASITGAADIHDFAAQLYAKMQQQQTGGV